MSASLARPAISWMALGVSLLVSVAAGSVATVATKKRSTNAISGALAYAAPNDTSGDAGEDCSDMTDMEPI